MPQRTALLILLWALPGYGMVQLQKGEHLLRGYYLKNGPAVQLILNKDTRAMDVIDLAANKDSVGISQLKSGTKIEVCLHLSSSKKDSNFKGDVLKLRPLGPAEPIIFYSGSLKGCPPKSGCKNFAKPLNGPLFGDMMLSHLPADYLNCQ